MQLWSMVIPVKVLAQAKSRLTGLVGPPRAQLALAMAADTVAAALATPQVASVVVVSDDLAVGAELGGLGAVVIADDPAAGLNPAMVFGASYADTRWPGRGRAAMAGDLPALRPGELTAALEAASVAGEAFVRTLRHADRGRANPDIPSDRVERQIAGLQSNAEGMSRPA